MRRSTLTLRGGTGCDPSEDDLGSLAALLAAVVEPPTSFSAGNLALCSPGLTSRPPMVAQSRSSWSLRSRNAPAIEHAQYTLELGWFHSSTTTTARPRRRRPHAYDHDADDHDADDDANHDHANHNDSHWHHERR